MAKTWQRFVSEFTRLLSFVVVASACSSTPPIPTVTARVIESPRATPSTTLTLIIPTPSRTIPSTQTSTTTPAPSETPQPSPTLPLATLAVVSTMDAIVAQRPELQEYYSYFQECVYYPHACISPGLGLSPNGLWAVFFHVSADGGGLKIIGLDGIKQWEVYFSELSGTEGPGTVSIAHWSQDGNYLYVFPRQDGADGGYEWFWGWQGTKLIRLDLETGTWSDTRMGYAFSFSPNDKYLAYRSETGVHIYTLRTGEEQVFGVPSKFEEYGRFTWSPDSQRVIFVAVAGDLETREDGFSTLLIDLETAATKIIFENDKRFIYPAEWSESNVILFKGLFDGQDYLLNLSTNEMVPVSTP